MLLLALAMLQDPPPFVLPVAPAPFVRKLQAKQVDRYVVGTVSSEETGSGGTALSSGAEFTVEIAMPKKLPDGQVIELDAKFLDEKIQLGRMNSSRKGVFGTVRIKLGASGLPEGLTPVGPLATYLVPLMALHIPTLADAAGMWTMAPLKLRDGTGLTGNGLVVREGKDGWKVEAAYGVTSSKDVPIANIKHTAWFDAKGGLLRANGTWTAKAATMKYDLRKI